MTGYVKSMHGRAAASFQSINKHQWSAPDVDICFRQFGSVKEEVSCQAGSDLQTIITRVCT